MATGKEDLAYLLDQLSALEGLTCRPMMGEYILYLNGKIAAYLCDGRLLVKPLPAALARLSDAPRVPPYEGAKPMLWVENVDDRTFLTELFEAMEPQLPPPKGKKKK